MAPLDRAARSLGPLPGRTRTYNHTTMTAEARRAFLSAGLRGERQAEGVAPGVRPGAAPKAETWYRLENMAGSAPELYLYGEIGCWGITASDLIAELQYVTAPEITVHLNSPGGEIFEGIAIYNALRSHTSNVTIRVDSMAASIGSVILQAGDRRIMQPYSQVMIHEGSGLCWGDAADMLEMATLLDKQSANISSVYADRAGGTPEAWREAMRTETWYTAEEAVAAGLADEVDVRAAEPDAPAAPTPTAAPAAMWDLTAYRHAGRQDAPAPILNTAAEPVETQAEPATETSTVEAVGAPFAGALKAALDGVPFAPETPEAPAEPVAVVDPPTEPVTEPDPWASLTAQLLTAPTWDDVTLRLREATK